MTGAPIDPRRFFRECPLFESLLLRVMFNPDDERLVLVYDYAAEVVSAHFEAKSLGKVPSEPPLRDFRRLEFLGVDDIRIIRTRRNRKKPGKVTTSPDCWREIDQECQSGPSVTILRADCAQLDAGFRLTLFLSLPRWDFTSDFRFTIATLTGRLGKADRPSGPARYFDVESGDEIPFENPFGDPR